MLSPSLCVKKQLEGPPPQGNRDAVTKDDDDD